MGALLALALAALCLPAASDFDGRWPRQMVSSIGLCRYGGRIDCCWGWARQSWGRCQPVCQPACKHGECVGPNKCKCHPGYAGKTCNQDLNECGLQPRPCKHRCMNTWGSFKCYCPSGYMRMPDGSCSGALTCSLANCQYDCDVVKGQVRCQCPSPGLQLAPDGRTCMDIDECALGRASCPPFRQCVNTFGSYVCKCQDGLDLVYIGGKYQCHDIPRVLVEPSGPIPGPRGNGSASKGDGGQSNRIPDVGRTQWPPRTPYIPPATVPTSRPTAKPTAPPTPPPTPRPTPRPTPPPPPPLPTHPRTPPPPPPTRGRPTPRMSTAAPATTVPATTSPGGGTMDNRIHTDPQKPRGDVFSKWRGGGGAFCVQGVTRGQWRPGGSESTQDLVLSFSSAPGHRWLAVDAAWCLCVAGVRTPGICFLYLIV
ncbi:nephronectin isoform X2 [Erinaceus europaeus]|uniref:Nephronectin isoform X2 n=1 Tax=Erinaceus europaeus TaxID=9365 RepID=A0ABM3X0E2_ERIEU|nr:nephronectin isoform X2 [Erinaceus europaeus]